MEQSRGQFGIGKIDAFGPYRVPKNLFQYGLNEWGQKDDGRMKPDVDAVKAGESQTVPVYGSGAITAKATSESDSTRSATATCSRP